MDNRPFLSMMDYDPLEDIEILEDKLRIKNSTSGIGCYRYDNIINVKIESHSGYYGGTANLIINESKVYTAIDTVSTNLNKCANLKKMISVITQKITEYNENSPTIQSVYRKLIHVEEKIDALMYGPGGPGAIEAKTRFEESCKLNDS